MTLQLLRDIVTVELFHRNVELIAYIAPQRAEHFVVEGLALALEHQLTGFLQSLARDLGSLLTTHLHGIGMVQSTFAEDDQQHDESYQRQEQRDPPRSGTEEEVAQLTLLTLARHDVVNVVGLLNIIVCRRTVTVAFVYNQLKRLRSDSLISIQIGVVISKRYRGNGVSALIAWHKEEVIDHVATHAGGCQLGLVGHLCVVFVEVLGEIDLRLLDQLEVAIAAYDHSEGDGITGFHFLLGKLSRDVELTHTTGEACWLGW